MPALLLCWLLCWCVSPNLVADEAKSRAARAAEPGEGYQHPLAGSALPGGEVPTLDLQDDAQGRRYAVQDSGLWLDGAAAQRRSELVLLGTTQLSAAERLQRRLSKPQLAAEQGQPTDQVLGQSLAEALNRAEPHTELRVALWLQPSESLLAIEGPVETVERALARGEASSAEEVAELRLQAAAQRREVLAAGQEPLLQAVGDFLVYRCRNLPCLVAEMPAAHVGELSVHPEVLRVDLVSAPWDLPAMPEWPGSSEAEGCPDTETIETRHVTAGMQLDQFLDHRFDGRVGDEGGAGGTRLAAAVIEGFGEARAFDGHVGFRDGISSSHRLLDCFECGPDGCGSPTFFSSPYNNHATFVTGLMMGDLRDGQDSAFGSSAAQERRSGYAPEAATHLLAADDGTGASGSTERRETIPAVIAALDQVLELSPAPAVVNMSWSADTGTDKRCRGKNDLSRAANQLFLHGHLLVKSAGNNGADDATDCTVGSPGSALSAFTVGGHCACTTGGEGEVRWGDISPVSSLGGVSWSEGRERSIVDATACLRRTHTFTSSGGYNSSPSSGTSTATPTVAGAALDFIDFYKHSYSNLIDRPGILFANLLLMGDRQGEGGSALNRGFDPRWGSGRMKMRRWDGAGVDAPAAWATGHTCVDDGEVVTLEVNGGEPLPAAVDDLKAVIWWYDSRHERGRTISDVDLWLRRSDGSSLRSSRTASDNKERVFRSNMGGESVRLEIEGFDVREDDSSCGRNSVRVYWAWFFEDDARNDSNGPGMEIETER